MKRPVTVTIAVVLQWVAAVIGVITGLDLIRAAWEIRRIGIGPDIENLLVKEGVIDVSGSTVVAGVFLAAIVVFAIALLRVVIALYLARGERWARIAVTVLVVLSLVGSLAYLVDGSWAAGLAGAVIDAVVLWLLYNAQAGAFFRGSDARQG